jgi:hypothetical protein
MRFGTLTGSPLYAAAAVSAAIDRWQVKLTGDHTAGNDLTPSLDTGEHSVQNVTADVVVVDIGVIRSSRLEVLEESGRLVVDALVGTE